MNLASSHQLSEIGYRELIWQIVAAVREAAQNIPTFRETHSGCIRITLEPLSQEGDSWIDGLDNYRRDVGVVEASDFCTREFVFKIDPRGSHVIMWTDPADGHREPVNCYGYSALKSAFQRFFRKGQTLPSPSILCEYFNEDNGWSTHRGTASARITLDGQDFVWLDITVSGANSEEDERCSLAGLAVAIEYLTSKPKLNLQVYDIVPPLPGR